MNQKKTYEVIITEKLQQLPLPDMEDAIWTRVKAQLDLDLPADDNHESTPDTPSGGGWYWPAGSFIFLAALVTIFLLTKKTENQPTATPFTPVQTVTPANPENNKTDTLSSVPALNPLQLPGLQTGNQPDVPSNAGSITPGIDSISVQSTLHLPQADSLQQTTLVVPSPVLKDTLPPKKRTRGVSGITDNDYRIVPAKKDSL